MLVRIYIHHLCAHCEYCLWCPEFMSACTRSDENGWPTRSYAGGPCPHFEEWTHNNRASGFEVRLYEGLTFEELLEAAGYTKLTPQLRWQFYQRHFTEDKNVCTR